MKIVHCLFTMEAAGAQVLTVGLLNEMCRDNEVELIIVNTWNPELLKQLDPKIKVWYINRKEGARSPLPLIKLNLLLMRSNADIIHCHEPNMVKIIKTKKKAKLFHTVHDVGIPISFYHKYDSLVAISDAVYNDITAKCLVPVSKIYNGIPITSFKRRTNYATVNGTPLKLVQVSRLVHEKKGQDILLQALSLIVKEYGCTNFTLDLVGSGSSEAYLQQMINDLELQGKVNLIGEKSRGWVLDNLCDYHMLVQPSRYEGFGLTIVEGFAAGLPVLASNIDGPKEIIESIPGGFLFENGNVEDCANELFRLLQLYQEGKMNELMMESMVKIEAKYSMTACAGNYLSEYERVLAPVA